MPMLGSAHAITNMKLADDILGSLDPTLVISRLPNSIYYKVAMKSLILLIQIYQHFPPYGIKLILWFRFSQDHCVLLPCPC